MAPFPFKCLLLFAMVALCGAYKVLVWSPTVSRSHMISNARVADTLARDGHDVTLVEVEYMVPVGVHNFSEAARTVHIPGGFMNTLINGKEFMKVFAEEAFKPQSALKSYVVYRFLNQNFNEACDKFLTQKREQIAQLRALRFDVIVSEQLTSCGAGVGHLLGIPTNILLSSCPIQEHIASIIGLPFPSSYVPSLADSDSPDTMSIWGRLNNFALQMAGGAFLWHGVDPLTHIFRKHFGPSFPDLRQIVRDSPFIFVAVDELVDFPRPVFPNVVYIGGLGIQKPKQRTELPEPFKSEMEKGAKGVVLFSMGSIMRSSDFPESFKENIFAAFAKFPDYHFVMKVEEGDNHSAEIASKMSNVFLTTWAPQSELLNHPRLRLFITHGGYNSLMESARAGVPLLAMGFFGDQYRNSRVAERNGWALAFDKLLLLNSHRQFGEALGEMLADPKYAGNAKRTQKLMLTKPFSAEERLTKSIRFLEQNGGKLPELLSESRQMGTVELYNLDLLALAACLLLGLLGALVWLAKRLWRKIGAIAQTQKPKAE